MKQFIFTLVFFIVTITFAQKELKVKTFTIDGCKRTKVDFLKQFLCLELGNTYSEEQRQLDICTLKNFRFFNKVDIQIDTINDLLDVKIVLHELYTTLPFISYGATSINYQLKTGFNKYNLFGRGASVGFKYMRYDMNSYLGYLDVPYLGKSKIGFRIEGGILSTFEPFQQDSSTFHFYERKKIAIEPAIQYSFAWLHRIKISTEFFNDRFKDMYYFDMPEAQGSKLKLNYQRNKIKYDLYQFRGNDVETELSQTFANAGRINQTILKFRWSYFYLKNRSNLAIRTQIGLSTQKYKNFSPFVADNYLNLRGVGNRTLRAYQEMVVNIEERYTLHTSKFGAFQTVVFSDNGVWNSINNQIKSYNFVGLGIRFTCFYFYNTTLRLDYGIAINDRGTKGFVFGLGHYF